MYLLDYLIWNKFTEILTGYFRYIKIQTWLRGLGE